MKNQHSRFILFCFFSILSSVGFAQGGPSDDDPLDPGLVSVYPTQGLSFGAFTTGSVGGTVSVSPAGLRSSSGSVLLLNYGFTYYSAIIEIDAPTGTIITVANGPNVSLTGSNGGTMTLKLGATSPVSPFTTTAVSPSRTVVNIGGTLTVGPPISTPPGSYSGTFDVYVNYQ